MRKWVYIVVAVGASLGLILAIVLVSGVTRSGGFPLMSIGLNLLSVGAAYGLLTLIFQDGHVSGLLGFSPYGAIVQSMPLFLFVILFGLSMDYHVFILSRIRELRNRGHVAVTEIREVLRAWLSGVSQDGSFANSSPTSFSRLGRVSTRF